MTAVLVLAADLAAAEGITALRERLSARGAVSVVLEGAATPRALMAAVKASGGEAATSWLATRDAALAAVAGTAGLYGVVVVGSGEDRDDGVLVRHSPDIAGISIAMVPRNGGCWH